ncbi:Flp family type IVb pilin [Phycicoccus sp. HDW14]|uniref:Flp family type IVb pilin n=1 Tax=Phycicoccus sp. HDW14 TaxID=2714941 RepID=UPI001407BBFD|nr:Flp family type IVb pilin [Phycicoccus sp. HDW14]QIM21417.1 Flp family type IVb pilin [Phycicoccus sp. HDW14]
MTSLLTRTSLRVRHDVERALQAHREHGATAVEYALMMALIALVIIASVFILGRNLSTFFRDAATSI